MIDEAKKQALAQAMRDSLNYFRVNVWEPRDPNSNTWRRKHHFRVFDAAEAAIEYALEHRSKGNDIRLVAGQENWFGQIIERLVSHQ